MLRIGIDIGGTKTELIALDDAGRECLRRRVPTPHGTYEDALQAIAAMVTAAERELGARASVGVGLPGCAEDMTGLVRNAFATPYNGRPLRADLERLIGREVRLANDANCFALSEARDGAARGARVVFGAILGTGAGGGIIVDGRLASGAHGTAGEWGHNPLPWMHAAEFPGPPCYCGRRGCIERFVSGPALTADHRLAGGGELAPAAIASGAAAGDAACQATLARHASRLARALAHVINLLDPDVIVLGGGLSNLGHLYGELPALWAGYLYGGGPVTRLVRAAHGDASGVRGAAMLWPG